LSSVRTDPAAHGRQAVQTLLAQLRPGTGVVDAVPAPVLVVRASCGAAPQR
jgi:DNA-binding LacI/PurR family transcriptional regulator